MYKLVQMIKKNDLLYKVLMKIYIAVYSVIQEKHSLCVAFNRLHSVLFGTKIDLYSKQSLKRYCSTHNFNFNISQAVKFRDVYVPKYYGNSDESKTLACQSPEIYTVTLTNVSIVGGSSFILKDKWILYDMFELDKDNRFDLRFGSIVSISDSGEVAIKSYNTKGKSIEKGIFLVGFGSHNYYHLTIELMGKFKYINSRQEFDKYPIIVDEVVLLIPQFKDLLDALNVSNREIISLKKYTRYEVGELAYVSDVSWMPINVKGSSGLSDEDCRVSTECISYLRSQVMKHWDIKFSSDSIVKLFLSRKSNFLQRLRNETAVASLFKQYGFKVIYPETLSLKEQVKLFASASVVVGTTGAALTNIIYCSSGTTFVSIIPKEYNFNVYSTIAYNLGLNPLYLDAKIIRKGRKISGDIFELDLGYCEGFLKNNSFGSGEID